MRTPMMFAAGTVMLVAVPALAAGAEMPTTAAAAAETSMRADVAAPLSAGVPAASAGVGAAQIATSATAGAVIVGATVKDTSGGVVGTIESIDGQYAVLATAKNKVRLPLASFGKGGDGPIITMSQAQVDAAASSATAKP